MTAPTTVLSDLPNGCGTSLLTESMCNNYGRVEVMASAYRGHYSKTVTVVIPHFNARLLLERCLYALTIQTYPLDLVQIIITDDGSAEQLQGIMTPFQGQLNITVLTHERKGFRLATVRNRGIVQANGDIVVLLDCDMIQVPSFIEDHLRWFHVSSMVATMGPRRFIDASHVPPAEVPHRIEHLLELPAVQSISNRNGSVDKRMQEFARIKNHPHPYNCFHGGNIGFSRQDALDIGLFDEDFNGHYGYEDIEFGHRLYRSGRYLVYEPKALAFHQESYAMSMEQRAADGAINRRKLYSKIPELEPYRLSMGWQ